MQVVVSTNLATRNSRFSPAPGTVPACPEILTISVAAWLIVLSLRLFDLNQEALGFGGVRVRIGHRGRQQIRRSARVSSGIFLNSAEALVNRQSNLVNLLAVNYHRLQPPRHKRF